MVTHATCDREWADCKVAASFDRNRSLNASCLNQRSHLSIVYEIEKRYSFLKIWCYTVHFFNLLVVIFCRARKTQHVNI